MVRIFWTVIEMYERNKNLLSFLNCFKLLNISHHFTVSYILRFNDQVWVEKNGSPLKEYIGIILSDYDS